MNTPTGWAMAERALEGVGDVQLGEWREHGNNGVVHLRRRLSDAEREALGGLGVRDIRGTAEERRVLDRLFREVPGLRPVLNAALSKEAQRPS